MQLKLKNSHASYQKKQTNLELHCWLLHRVGLEDSDNGMLQQTLTKRFGSSIKVDDREESSSN